MTRLRSIFIFALLTLIFVSCDDKNEDGSFYLEFDKKEVKLNAIESTSDIIEISSSSTWSLDTELPDWLTVSSLVGYASPKDIVVTAKRNNNMEKREVTLVFHNGDGIEKSIKVTQLGIADSEPLIELSERSVAFALEGTAQSIDLTTNVSWEITSIPQWVIISSKSGDKSIRITIGAENNDQIKGREATLTFSSMDGKVQTQLIITQIGRDDIMQSPSLPIFQASIYTISNNGHYGITTNKLFVSSVMRDKIYLGNLMEGQTDNYPAFPVITGYTFNPNTASTASSENLTVKTFIPSLLEQETFAAEVINNPPRENANATYDYFNPTSYLTHRLLYAIGWANMGIALDKIVSNKSYKEQEMTRKNGMIFSFKHTLFSLIMDHPEKLIQEELNDMDKAKAVSYIGSMEYGKVGLLIVESDAKYDRMKEAVRRVLIGNIHQAEDNALIEAADIVYVYFNNKNEVQVNRDNNEAINAYKAAFRNKKDRENIYPVGFTLSNFRNHSADKITYSFDAPR